MRGGVSHFERWGDILTKELLYVYYVYVSVFNIRVLALTFLPSIFATQRTGEKHVDRTNNIR